MASEWVGVVGTGIGATVGGIVTVASLVVRSRQESTARMEAASREDRLRNEDRRWELARQDVRQRRETYTHILRTISDYDKQLQWIEILVADPDHEGTQRTPPAGSLEAVAASADKAFGLAVGLSPEVDLLCVDPAVGDLTRTFIGRATAIQAEMAASRWEAVITISEEVRQLLPELREACRRDLMLDEANRLISG